MKVRAGWSTQYGKHKFDVELEEDRDLPQLLDDCGIGRERAGELTVREKLSLLWDETEVISATTEAVEAGVKPQESPKVLAMVRRQLVAQSRIKTRLDIITEEEAKALAGG